MHSTGPQSLRARRAKQPRRDYVASLAATGIFISLSVLAVSGCATIDSRAPRIATEQEAPKLADPAVPIPLSEGPTKTAINTEKGSGTSPVEFHPDSIENLTIDEVIRMEEPNTQGLYDDSRYDFPITMNSRVEGWIDYFTNRGRPHMERYLARSSRYIPTMKAILKENGLPEDLVYLALIESGFNLRANSRARAVGPWQFMKPTGRRYGLRVDAWIDERRDPIKSTVAAARYLKDLYLMFESWYLAASAYNAGEYKILRAIETLKTNNYWRICQAGFLRRETKDYIPKLIAAAILAKNPQRFGFEEIEYEEPLRFETVNVDFTLQLKDLATLLNVPVDELEDLNPGLRRAVIPPDCEYALNVPPGAKALVGRALAHLKVKDVPLPVQYTVRAGDTLASIARIHRVATRELAQANNMAPREKLVPGSTLLVPTLSRSRIQRPRRSVSSIDAGPGSKSTRSEDFVTHTVRRGESLWSIAEQYEVTVQDLFRWNGLKKSRIDAGKKIRVKRSGGAPTASVLNRTHDSQTLQSRR